MTVSTPPPFMLRGHLTRAALKPALAQTPLPHRLNLADASHVRKGGLLALLDLAHRLDKEQRRLSLEACPPALAALLDFLGFDLVADILPAMPLTPS